MYYFIGKMLNSSEARSVKKVKDIIIRKYGEVDREEKVVSEYTPLYMLGYYDDEYEDKLRNLLDPILSVLKNKYSPIKCFYEGVGFTDYSTYNDMISLLYTDKDNLIHNQIVPYIKKSFTETLKVPENQFDTENFLQVPLFKLNKGKKSRMLKAYETDRITLYGLTLDMFSKFPIPYVSRNENTGKNYFLMNSIDLLRATPLDLKSGRKSMKSDKVRVELVDSYSLRARNNRRMNNKAGLNNQAGLKNKASLNNQAGLNNQPRLNNQVGLNNAPALNNQVGLNNAPALNNQAIVEEDNILRNSVNNNRVNGVFGNNKRNNNVKNMDNRRSLRSSNLFNE